MNTNTTKIIKYLFHLVIQIGGRGFRNDAGEDIDQQHAERDGRQQQRFKVLCDGQIKEDARDEDHHVVSPGQARKGSLLCQVGNCLSDIAHK